MIPLLRKIRRAECFKKIAMPQFKHQQAPNAARVDAPTLKVLVQESADSFGIKISTLKGAGFE
jgi:hypothetical protein